LKEINLPKNVCEEIESYYSKVIQEKDFLYIEKEKLFSALRLLALQYPNPEDAVDDFNLAALVDIPSNISQSGSVNSNLKGKSHIPLKSKPSNQESKPSELTKPKSEVSVGLRKKLEVIKKLEDIVQQIIDLDDEFYAKIGLCIESEVRKYYLQEPQIMETKQRILSAMLSNSMPKIFKRHGNLYILYKHLFMYLSFFRLYVFFFFINQVYVLSFKGDILASQVNNLFSVSYFNFLLLK
jgi:hypothetical protein